MTLLLRLRSNSILLAFLMFGSVLNAQTEITHQFVSDPLEDFIVGIYGQDWVDKNDEAVKALIHCVHNRITYQEVPLEPGDKFPLLSSYPLMNKLNPTIVEIDYLNFSPATFIPLVYNLPYFSNKTEVIRVDGTNYVIVIEPQNKH